MGYCISQQESIFNIKAKHKPDVLKAIKSLAGKETHKYKSSNYSDNFSWVETAVFLQAETLEEALDEWRWHPQVDKEENIIGLEFTGEKYGDDKTLFTAIAPYVEDGSFITMKGEDGEMFRWVFNNKKFKEEQGKITIEWES